MANQQFSENSRVQVPAAIHLMKLGYQYLADIDEQEYDHDTNILTDVFVRSYMRINVSQNVTEQEARQKCSELIKSCGYEDLGRDFYTKITSTSSLRCIDFEHPENNEWHCTTEFTCRNDQTLDEFRPDITVFVNGLPLAFIEVKIPNNRDGIMAERDRIERRMHRHCFHSFFGATQLMIFSNNQEYDHEAITPIQGAFYATVSKEKCFFNTFREEDNTLLEHCGYTPEIDEAEIQKVLIHRNYHPRENDPVYQMNLQPGTPTNRIITSLLSKERLLFLLRFGFAHLQYTEKEDEEDEGREKMEKHIMRYPQLFASYAIQKRLDTGQKGGIIWHTQGSGKTALAYYNVRALTDYYAKRNTIAKFYFIVDRIDLMDQATDEFTKRGMKVVNFQDRESLMANIADNSIVEDKKGELEINVVNIQKFKENGSNIRIKDTYDINLVRIFFIDEAHRGYNPKGSFLANLLEADKNAVKIALTGTPLLAAERSSWKVFGKYIHTYYYDKSIADGYTLKLMREDISFEYKEKIKDVISKMSDVKVRLTDVDKNEILCAENLLLPIIEYAEEDIRRFRIQQNDKTLAAMIVCKTNPQARKLHEMLQQRVAGGTKNALRSALILHDEDDKETRKKTVKEFKRKETIDVLVVNAMLLTGFDAHRLKKLYLMRPLQNHDLLQALTRVNRPHGDMRYGYVVDFANIQQKFEEANNMYLRELNMFGQAAQNEAVILDGRNEGIGDSLMLTDEDIHERVDTIQDTLWNLPTDNPEAFREEMDEIKDKAELYTLKGILEDARALSNQIRSFGTDEQKAFFRTLDFATIPTLLKEVCHRIDRLNDLESTDRKDVVSRIIREAIASIEITVQKRGEDELRIIYNQLLDRYKDVQHEFDLNIDKFDPKYVELSEAFQHFFKTNNINAADVQHAKENLDYMDDVMKKIRDINRYNARLQRIYSDDRFVRVHKRINEENGRRASATPRQNPIISANERHVAENLKAIKRDLNMMIWLNENIVSNQSVFDQQVMYLVSNKLVELGIQAMRPDRMYIRNQITREYAYRN